MKNKTTDIYEMLDTLSLPVAAQRFAELSKSPEFGSYTALQFIREVLEPQYIEMSIPDDSEPSFRKHSTVIPL